MGGYRVLGRRCDRWEPRVRPEPTSTVRVQSGKMRLVGLAVFTRAVVYYLVPFGTPVYSSQVRSCVVAGVRSNPTWLGLCTGDTPVVCL